MAKAFITNRSLQNMFFLVLPMKMQRAMLDLGEVSNFIYSTRIVSLTCFNLDFYEHLINLPVGGITPHRRVNVNSVDDVSEAERGLDTSRAELMVMLNNANASQKSVYTQVIRDFRTNSVAFVSGAAGTGKSYVLRMFERHYRLKGYKVTFNLHTSCF